MPYAHDYDDLKVPEEITKNKDVSALSDFSKEKYGRAIDKRWKWNRAIREAARLRGRIVNRRKKEENKQKDVIIQSHEGTIEESSDNPEEDPMNQKEWPWKEGYKFAVPGPRSDSSCYVRDINKGVDFFCLEENLSEYLEEGFDISSANSEPAKASKSKPTPAKATATSSKSEDASEDSSKAGLTSITSGE